MSCKTVTLNHSCQMMAAAKLSFAAAAGCFVTAIFGYVVNQFASDAICAEGLAVVGCFYLVIGGVDFGRVRWSELSIKRRERANFIRPTLSVQFRSHGPESEEMGMAP
ncbi:MAG: hypothetical protein ACI9G1_002214 [Pirellulaceae bacterium]|jgi:hypothetical protein